MANNGIASDDNFDKHIEAIKDKLRSEGIDIDRLIERGMKRMKFKQRVAEFILFINSQDYRNN